MYGVFSSSISSIIFETMFEESPLPFSAKCGDYPQFLVITDERLFQNLKIFAATECLYHPYLASYK